MGRAHQLNSSQDDNNVQTTCGKIGTNKPTTNHATTKLMKDQTIVIVLGRGSTDLYVEADDVDKRGPNDNCATPLQEQRAAKQRVIYIYCKDTWGVSGIHEAMQSHSFFFSQMC